MELLGIIFLILLVLIPLIRQHLRDQKNEERYRVEAKKSAPFCTPVPYTVKEPPPKPVEPELKKANKARLRDVKQGLIFSMILKNPYHEEG